MPTFLDASLVICHLTGDPADHRDAAAHLFESTDSLLLSDVTVADTIEVLESSYSVDRHLVATSIRSLLARPNVVSVDTAVLLRAVGIYEIDGVRFPAAHSVALAESTGVDRVASLDETIDRVQTVERLAAVGE